MPLPPSVAKDRGWFQTYVPFRSTVGTGRMSPPMRVHGIGDVILPVKRRPGASAADRHGHMHLKNVLHCPEAVCNIFCPSNNLDISFSLVPGSGGPGPVGALFGPDNQQFGYLAKRGVSGFSLVKLSPPPLGPPYNPTPLDNPDARYYIHATWSNGQRRRWNGYEPPYNSKEKAWLKKHFGGEFQLLRMYGLSIYDEENRVEGRGIARTFMAQDEGDGGRA